MQTIKLYVQGVINGVLLSAGFMNFLDGAVRIVSVLAGVVLTIFLIRKAQHDITSKKLDNQLKKIQIEEMERNKKTINNGKI